MKRILSKPLLWLASLLLLCVIKAVVAWDDWRIRCRIRTLHP